MISFIVLVGMCFVVIRLISAFPKIVMTEEKTTGGFMRKGFSVRQSRLGYGAVVNLWAGDARGVYQDVRLDRPRLRVKKIKQHNWLRNNEAILLAMDTEIDLGSYSQPDERWLLYDFKSGALRMCSTFERTSCADPQASAPDQRSH